MRVLVACEFSGIVRDAFVAKGHDAWSCDLLPTDRPGNHIQDDVLKHLDDGWDLMIAHPPCTKISNAGARFLYPRGVLDLSRYKDGEKGAMFFMRFFHTKIKRVCV
jgi:site-specific DNA-cytosine methylase